MEFIGYLLIAGIISFIITRRSAMSFGWAFFFAVCFSIIGGIIAVLKNGKYGRSKKKTLSDSQNQMVKCIISGLISIILIWASIKQWPTRQEVDVNTLTSDINVYFANYDLDIYNQNLRESLIMLFWGIGFIGNIIYIVSDSDTYVYEPLELIEEVQNV